MTSILPDGPALAPTPDNPDADTVAPPMARTDPRHGRQRRRYKIRGPETWALIRESYLAGGSARELALRYDVTEWNIWRRAWKEGWTKLDRVEPAPPPALEPVMPPMDLYPDETDPAGDGDPDQTGFDHTGSGQTGPDQTGPDPQTLIRQALRGVASALRQNRLAEARNLSMIAASLERIGGSGRQGGGFTLGDMVRIVYDPEFRTETMRMDPDRENPPEKEQYWTLRKQQDDELGQTVAALRSRGYAEGRAELRAELGLEPEPEAPDHWVWYYGAMVQHSVMEEKREQARERQAQWAMRAEAGEDEGGEE